VIFISTAIQAQPIPNHRLQKTYNTKKNYVFTSFALGGGDYPCASLGLNLSRQIFNGDAMAGVAIHYIGTTDDGSRPWTDPAQIFPIMVDLRYKFNESRDGRFATYIIADGGYVISITGNGENEFGPYKILNGWAISPGIAFRFNVLENLGVMLDITWFHHSSAREWLPPTVRKDYKHWNLGLVRGHVFF
jgi:hypothetical protein